MFYNLVALLISRAGFRSENLKRVLWEDELTGKNSLYEKQGNYGYLWSEAQTFNPRPVLRGQLFSKEKI